MFSYYDLIIAVLLILITLSFILLESLYESNESIRGHVTI